MFRIRHIELMYTAVYGINNLISLGIELEYK